MLYQVETKNLNKAASRNVDRFPEDFRFKLTKEEFDGLRFQIGTSNEEQVILIDGYVDVNTLNVLAKKKTDVDVKIYTYMSAHLSSRDTAIFNAQYPTLTVEKTQVFHDRFIILDGNIVYHIGASIKDAGKKCFGISRIDDSGVVADLLKRLERE